MKTASKKSDNKTKSSSSPKTSGGHEGKIAAHQDLYRFLVEESNDLIVVLGFDGEMVSANAIFQKATGLTSNEWSGKDFFKLIHCDDIAELKVQFNNCVDGKISASKEIRIKSKLGRYHIYNIRLGLITGAGNTNNVMCVARDITESRAADSALRRSESFLSSLLENAPFMVYITGKEYHLLMANKACDSTLGFAVSRMCGQKMDSIFPEAKTQNLRLTNNRVLEEKKPLFAEVDLDSPAGRRNFHIVKFPLLDENGNAEAVGNVLLDISSLKKHERISDSRAEYLSGLVGLTNITEIAQTTFNHIRRLMPCDAGSIILLKEKGRNSIGEVIYNFDTDEDGKMRIREHRDSLTLGADSFTMQVINRGETLKINRSIDDMQKVLLKTRDNLIYNSRVSRALVFVPLKIHGQIIGVMSVQSYAANVFDADAINILESISADIALATTAARTSEALIESEERYRSIWENSPLGICLTDIEGILNFANSKFCQMYGYTREELLGRSIFEMIKSDESIHYRTAGYKARFLEGNSFPICEARVFRKDGTPIWINYFGDFIKQGNSPLYMISMCVDITEQKNNERIKIDVEEKLRILIEHTPDATIFLDSSGVIVDANKATEKIARRTKAEIVGKMIFDFNLFSNEDLKRMKSSLQSFRAGHPSESEVYEIRHSDGDITIIESFAHAIKINDKNLIMVIVRDITARRNAEIELMQSEERFAKAFHSSPTGLSISSVDKGHFIDVNDSLLKIFEYSRDEVVGHTASELNMFQEQYRRDELVKRLRNRETICNYETIARTKSGKTITILFSSEEIILKGESYILATIVDISERKQSERMLIRSTYLSSRLRDAVVTMNQCSSIKQAVKPLLDAALDISGFEGGGIYTIENNQAVLITHRGFDPDFVEKIKTIPIDSELVQSVLKSGGSVELITNLPAIRGLCAQYGFIHAYTFPLRSADGEILGFINFATTNADRPETADFEALEILASEAQTLFHRLRAEEELQASEEEYRRIVETASEGIWTLDENYITTYVNETMANMLGYRSEEMIGQPLDNFMFSDDMENHRRHIERRQNGEHDSFDRKFRRKDGSEHWFHVSATSLRDKNKQFIGAFAMLTDISDKVWAMKALEEEAVRRRILVEQSKDGIIVLEEDGQVYETNAKHAEMLGYTIEETLKLHVWDWDCQWSREELLGKLQGIGPEGIFIETRHKRKDGTMYDVEISANGAMIGGRKLVFCVTRDVTERKSAEEALRVSEQINRAIIEHSPLGISVRGRDGRLLSYNNSWLKIWRKKEAPVIESSLNSQTKELRFDKHDDYLGEYQFKVREIYERGGYLLIPELKLKYQSEASRWVSQHFYALHDQSGAVERVVILTEDISDRKMVEEALKKSEKKIRSILLSAPTGIGLVINREIREVNPKVCEISGYSREELINQNARILYPSDEEYEFVGKEKYRQISEKGSGTVQTVFRRKDGTDINVILSSTPLDITDLAKGVTFTVLDITDTIRANEALKLERERLANVIEGTNVGTWEWKIPTGEIVLNERWAEIIGFTLSEISPISIETWVKFTRPDDIQKSNMLLEKHFNKELEYYECECRMRHKNGSWIWILDRGKVVERDRAGKPLRMTGTHTDITQRKLAEEALRTSEERYRLLIENSNEAIFVARDGIVLFSNERLSEITGYSLENIVSSSFLNFVYSDDKDMLVRRHKGRMIGAEIQSDFDFRVVTQSGTIKWLRLTSVRIIWEGSPAALYFAADITERKETETALIDSEIKFRTIFENSADPMFMMNEKFIDCNQKACELWGAERSEIVGHDPAEFSPEFQPNGKSSSIEAQGKISQAMRGIPQAFYWQHRKKDGTLIDTEVNLKKFSFGGEVFLTATVRDITQRLRAEEALKRLVTAVEQSAEGILITDTNGAIQYVNPAFETITGYSRDEIIGENPSILKSGEQDKDFYNKMWSTLKRGETWSGQLINRRKDGTLYNEVMTISPVLDGTGALINYVGVMRDVTKHVALEQMFNQSQKMEAVGRLAGGVAHDFNNLLTAISGYSEFLLNKIPEDNQLYADVQEIRKAGERAASLTRQLLAFSRKQIVQPKILNLNTVISDMNKMLKRLIGEDVELLIMLSDTPTQIKADPGQIEQVVMNLAINARDAMPDGGKLIIETANIKVKDESKAPIPGMKAGSYIMLAIHDSGTGINPEIKAHIFEPFFTTKEQGKGTGLGLATVYAIVEQSGGYIECESDIGRGSSFRIYMPRSEDSIDKNITAKLEKLTLTGSETILVVEDEEMVRNLTCRVLKDYGYNVISASTPGEAIKICESFEGKIHLLLTDVVMPGMSGVTLAAELKGKFTELKTLLMSGYTDSSYLGSSANQVTDFIQKPFKREVLISKIREMLDDKSMAQSNQSKS